MEVLHKIGRSAALLAFVVAILPVAARGRQRNNLLRDGVCGDSGTMLEAAREGKAMLRQALARGTPWGDKSLNEYVNRLGQNLVRSSGSQQVFSFYVLYNPEVNAQSYPGGYIVVNSGVISQAENEAELASILSHEIAHENACDWRTAPDTDKLIKSISLVPIVALGGPAGIIMAAGSGLALAGSNFAGKVVRARFSRAQEERADRLGAQYLGRAGYDPHAGVQFLGRIQDEQDRSGKEPGGLLASHPRLNDRRKNLEKFVVSLPPPAFAVQDEAEFLCMRQAVRDYDQMYSRLVGAAVPAAEGSAPEHSDWESSPAAR